jgi:hypothetical protein
VPPTTASPDNLSGGSVLAMPGALPLARLRRAPVRANARQGQEALGATVSAQGLQALPGMPVSGRLRLDHAVQQGDDTADLL